MNQEDIDDILRTNQDERSHENVRSQFWRKVKRAANQVPFIDEVVAAYFCAMDPQTPTRVRGILLASLAYFILPLDAVPDFLLFFGFSDDIAVLTAAFATVRGEITEAHRKAARDALQEDQFI